MSVTSPRLSFGLNPKKNFFRIRGYSGDYRIGVLSVNRRNPEPEENRRRYHPFSGLGQVK